MDMLRVSHLTSSIDSGVPLSLPTTFTSKEECAAVGQHPLTTAASTSVQNERIKGVSPGGDSCRPSWLQVDSDSVTEGRGSPTGPAGALALRLSMHEKTDSCTFVH